MLLTYCNFQNATTVIFISVTSDYITDLSSGGVIVVNASNPRVNVSFSLIDDTVFETNETLFANLNFTFSSHTRVILDPISAEVIVLGDDGKSKLSYCQLSKVNVNVLTNTLSLPVNNELLGEKIRGGEGSLWL